MSHSTNCQDLANFFLICSPFTSSSTSELGQAACLSCLDKVNEQERLRHRKVQRVRFPEVTENEAAIVKQNGESWRHHRGLLQGWAIVEDCEDSRPQTPRCIT